MIANFALIGFGFYMLHGCIQVQTTEIAPDARGAAVSFHSFFFLGQAIRPVAYGLGLAHAGLPLSLILGAVTMAAVGLYCAAFSATGAGFP